MHRRAVHDRALEEEADALLGGQGTQLAVGEGQRPLVGRGDVHAASQRGAHHVGRGLAGLGIYPGRLDGQLGRDLAHEGQRVWAGIAPVQAVQPHAGSVDVQRGAQVDPGRVDGAAVAVGADADHAQDQVVLGLEGVRFAQQEAGQGAVDVTKAQQGDLKLHELVLHKKKGLPAGYCNVPAGGVHPE